MDISEKQREVWDSIAPSWTNFRKNPIPGIAAFIQSKKGNILDLGCGSGRNFVKISGKIYGVDFSKEMLKYARETADKNNINVSLTLAPLDRLSFPNDFFDSAICIAALHCIPSEKTREKTLKELYRVLKPGAEAFISVWDRNQPKFEGKEKEIIVPWKQNGKEYGRYYYLYDKDEIINLLKKVGFQVLNIKETDTPEAMSSKKNIDVMVKK